MFRSPDYGLRLDEKFEFCSMPLTFLLCCCGCGKPCKTIWNYSRQLPKTIMYRIHHKSRSTFVQPTEHKQLLQWYLFQLPQPVRFYTWGHCIGQRFIDVLIYNRSRYDLVARTITTCGRSDIVDDAAANSSTESGRES
ncbi:Retrovirus-related Pol polyprotein from transposon TNT 1-94 [Fusarium oxysporum f. sp. albedinis]|nr:Retrovirus-related Pol polyprotein from transposon TNT 1-94 [Fusarium oxysporum f. sp. albedinis]